MCKTTELKKLNHYCDDDDIWTGLYGCFNQLCTLYQLVLYELLQKENVKAMLHVVFLKLLQKSILQEYTTTQHKSTLK